MIDRDEILRTVERLVVEVAGDELLLTGPITMTTSFNADLELESIEFVALAEKLSEHYGEGVDFVGWISTSRRSTVARICARVSFTLAMLPRSTRRCNRRRAPCRRRSRRSAADRRALRASA